MKKIWLICTLQLFLAGSVPFWAEAHLYGERLCEHPDFYCITVKEVRRGVSETWESLWPDKKERNLIKRINRLSVYLHRGMRIAVPKDKNKDIMDLSPFPRKIEKPEEKFFVYNRGLSAWATYGVDGSLIKWGPALGGKKYCHDIKRSCTTKAGEYRAMKKYGFNYRSSLYPLNCTGKECAEMFWYVRIQSGGMGIHGVKYFRGYNRSHGCIHTFIEDAKWLNKKFFEGKTKNKDGTKIIIR